MRPSMTKIKKFATLFPGKPLGGEVSTWKAAEIAGVSLRKMNKILQEKGVEMHYSEESLKEDLE